MVRFLTATRLDLDTNFEDIASCSRLESCFSSLPRIEWWPARWGTSVSTRSSSGLL